MPLLRPLALSFAVLLACGDDDMGCPDGSVSTSGRCIASVDGGGVDAEQLDGALDVLPDAPSGAITIVGVPDFVRVRVETTTLFEVELSRDGYDGPITLALDGLPPGVTSTPLEIASGETSAEVGVVASSAAAGGPFEISVTATGDDVASVSGSVLLYVSGRPGEMDSSFISTSVGDAQVATDAVIDSDGRIVLVAAHEFTEETRRTGLVARLAETGQLDDAFGSGGLVELGASSAAFGVATAGDNLRVLGGLFPTEVFDEIEDFVRGFDENGAVDSTFGVGGDAVLPGQGAMLTIDAWGGGFVLTSFLSESALVAIDADGSVAFSAPTGGDTAPAGASADDAQSVTTGALSYGTSDYILHRIDATNAPVTGFGEGGTLTIPGSSGFSAETRVVLSRILPDGSVYAAGNAVRSSPRDSTSELFKVAPDGSLDTSFARAVFSDSGEVQALESLPDGSLLVLGWDWDTDHVEIALIRHYLADGTLDLDFADAGTLLVDSSTLQGFGSVGVFVVDARVGRVIHCASNATIECKRYWL